MKMTCLKNGPILINLEKPITVTDEAGNQGIKSGPIALCRCGMSRTKPFCDGHHKHVGFEAELVELDE